jgi:hypothetical protein
MCTLVLRGRCEVHIIGHNLYILQSVAGKLYKCHGAHFVRLMKCQFIYEVFSLDCACKAHVALPVLLGGTDRNQAVNGKFLV